MVIRATAINPELLRWARDAVRLLGRGHCPPPSCVAGTGTRMGSPGQVLPNLETVRAAMAPRLSPGLRCFFFFKDPPEEKTVTERYSHRLPAEMLEDLHPDTLYAVRQARYRQDDLVELLGADGPGERFILRDLRGAIQTPAIRGPLATAVREYLGNDPEDPEAISNPAHPFEDWRRLVEDAGVWVFKRSFRQKDDRRLLPGRRCVSGLST